MNINMYVKVMQSARLINMFGDRLGKNTCFLSGNDVSLSRETVCVVRTNCDEVRHVL